MRRLRTQWTRREAGPEGMAEAARPGKLTWDREELDFGPTLTQIWEGPAKGEASVRKVWQPEGSPAF